MVRPATPEAIRAYLEAQIPVQDRLDAINGALNQANKQAAGAVVTREIIADEPIDEEDEGAVERKAKTLADYDKLLENYARAIDSLSERKAKLDSQAVEQVVPRAERRRRDKQLAKAIAKSETQAESE